MHVAAHVVGRHTGPATAAARAANGNGHLLTAAGAPAERDVPTQAPVVICVGLPAGAYRRLLDAVGREASVVLAPDLRAAEALVMSTRARPGPDPLAPGAAPGPAGVCGLAADPLREELTWHGRALPLTRLEQELLRRLADAPLRVWHYDQLHRSVWRTPYLGDRSGIVSAVKRLRHKLDAAGTGLLVEAVRGVGFRLVPAEPVQAG